ncbi:SRPBCC family protein [Cellulomonas endometrii]|uniref:SRPBCC family protein n=1 Tax=Cellulomonas endometrii TaxID=3036301 RepID=UPI0024AD4903|nr:SRPBCC family protein [Cellulomonas endometrii]
MTTTVEKSLLVNVPVSVAYNQWTQFEDFPRFMGGVKKVTQLGDDRLQWVAEIAGVKREWEARILEQVPDQKVAWAATQGATNAGAVTFEDVGGGQTSVRLHLEYEPEGLVEKVGDKLNVVENQAEKDLERFKAFIEDEGYATGAWRGTVGEGAGVGTPGVEHAAASQGDKGKAGVSAKAVAAGVGLAAAGAAAAAATRKDDTVEVGTIPEVDPVVPVVVEEETVVVDDVLPGGTGLGTDDGTDPSARI